jgi:two-component system, cell cycle sensor histidine kinase PleC
MVRALAASAILLRGPDVDSDPQTRSHPAHSPNINLDRMVVVLVLIFLSVVIGSIALQSTSSWHEQLEANENGLRMAANLTAMRLAQQGEKAESVALTLPPLPTYAAQPGRRFVILDAAGLVRGGHTGIEDLYLNAGRLFANPATFEALARSGKFDRIALRDGTMASVIVVRTEGLAGALLAYQPLKDELQIWWRHASAIATILLCFGAVTIAFTAVFYLQRQRACTAGTDASHMNTLAELALDQGQCGLWDWKLDTGSLHWSDSMHRLLGGTSNGGIAKSEIADRLHPDDAGLLDAIRQAIAAGQRDFSRLFRMRNEAGGWHWLRMRAVAVSGARQIPDRMFGIVMDVTQERVIEEDSHRADIRLRDAIESLSEAFVLWDENNRLVMCNSKYQAFHDLPPELVQRGVAYKTLMAAAREPRVLIEIDRGSRPDTGARTYEAQFHDSSWLLVSERPTNDGGYVSVGTDITARKQQEARLIDNERQLQMTISDLGNSREAFRRQAGQLAELADRYLEQKAEAVSANRAKAEFLANMNHEIRTPLNHIIGFAEMIEREVFGPCGSERYTEYARDIGTSGTALMALISDILDMARIEAGRVMLDRVPTPLGTLLANAAAEIRDVAKEKNLAIEIEPEINEPAGMRRILVDPDAINQAMVHLLRNSIRLSPAGGRVSIRARMNGDHVNIFIADPGCTLSAGDLGKMADPFGHIDGMLQDGCKGSGLGISIARSLIELHGGTMRLRSSAQIGSLIMIHLPITPNPIQLDLPMNG